MDKYEVQFIYQKGILCGGPHKTAIVEATSKREAIDKLAADTPDDTTFCLVSAVKLQDKRKEADDLGIHIAPYPEELE